MVWFVVCAALVASATSVALFTYWRRDKPARRSHRDAALVALGVMWGLIALSHYLGHSTPRWMAWVCAVLAVATPIKHQKVSGFGCFKLFPAFTIRSRIPCLGHGCGSAGAE